MSSNTSYNRDVVVNCLTRHYDLLIRMRQIESSDVLRPPSSGRSLLMHIPNLTREAESSSVHIYYEMYPRSYLRDDLSDFTAEEFCDMNNTPPQLCPFQGTLPSDMISLSNEDAVGPWWLVDTNHGLLYPWGDSRTMGDVEDHPGKPWLAAKARPIQEYFDRIHAEIHALRIVPSIAVGCWGARMEPCKAPEGKAMADMYRQYGWQDAFKRNDFMRAREAEAEWESE